MDRFLAKTGRDIIPFEELLPEETLLACKKVLFLLVFEYACTISYQLFAFKIGEGSFGEVFMLPSYHYDDECGSGAVLKIVPVNGDTMVNGEPQTKLAGKWRMKLAQVSEVIFSGLHV